MKLYKVLNDNKSCSGGDFDWTDYLPADGKPGKWTPTKRSVKLCHKGYHGTDAAHVRHFIEGNQLWEVEAIDPIWDAGRIKFVCKSMRLTRQVDTWNDKTLRLFACWCVRQIWGKLTDDRSKRVVEAAERFVNGDSTLEELSAARTAAWGAGAAARGAGAAAWAVTWAAQTKKLVEMLGLEEFGGANENS